MFPDLITKLYSSFASILSSHSLRHFWIKSKLLRLFVKFSRPFGTIPIKISGLHIP